MEMLIGAAIIGYAYKNSGDAMKDKQGQKIVENNVPRHQPSVDRRMRGSKPKSYEDQYYAWDNYESKRPSMLQPLKTNFNDSDPGWKHIHMDPANKPHQLNPDYDAHVQHFTSESFKIIENHALALKSPNISFRGNYSEIGNMRAVVPKDKPPRHSRVIVKEGMVSKKTRAHPYRMFK